MCVFEDSEATMSQTSSDEFHSSERKLTTKHQYIQHRPVGLQLVIVFIS